MSQQQQQKEDSVMFSLRSLMTIEDDRIRQEEAARLQAVEAARVSEVATRRRAEVERVEAARSAAEAKAADERATREAETRAAREREEATLRIRLEAESKQREREMQLRMEQEQRLATIAAQQTRGVQPGVMMAGIVGLALVLMVGTFFGVVRPQQQASALETQRSEAARRDSDARRVVAERAADEARARAAQADAERQRMAALAAQPMVHVAPPVPPVGPTHVHPRQPPRTRPVTEVDPFIGIGDTLPEGE